MSVSSTIPVARRGRAQPMPTRIAPMLATLAGHLPADPENWGVEFKWDGVRAICYWDGSRLRLLSRNLLDITSNYPELHALTRALGRRRAVLDGEIVAVGPEGIPSFAQLQRRMHVSQPTPRLVRQVPVTYLLFDLLHLNGRSTLELPYRERRELLEKLTLKGPSWEVPPMHVGEGQTMLDAARKTNLEGIVVKHVESTYEPGRRSAQWLKIKLVMEQEFVIGGWVPEGGTLHTRVGSLLLGYYGRNDSDRQLHFAGAVGSGFSDATHAKLVGMLSRRTQANSPFAQRVPKANAIWTRPELVAQIHFRRWPVGGRCSKPRSRACETTNRRWMW
jgi:bifunctional non-homologous end joining protein LigD